MRVGALAVGCELGARASKCGLGAGTGAGGGVGDRGPGNAIALMV